LQTRTFNLVRVAAGHGVGINVTAADAVMVYTGAWQAAVVQ
jgi:hypothetical protein